MLKKFKLNILVLHLSEIYGMQINCCVSECRFDIGMHLDVYEVISFKCDGRHYQTLHFDTSLSDLDLNPKSQGCEKVKALAPVISQSSCSI